jgi:curved DNA-binding protein CbpA
MNPYEVLGLGSDCSKEAVRSAYRAMAKTHHPDKGGDRAKFSEIKLAHDILMDEDRRARYDATGEATETEPDNNRSECVMRIKTAILNATQIARNKAQESNPPRGPLTYDILALAKNNLVDHSDQVKAQIASIEARRDFMIDLGARFKKDGSDDIIAMIFADDIRTMNANILQCVAEVDKTAAALQLFEGYSFEADKVDPVAGRIMGKMTFEDLASLFGASPRETKFRAGPGEEKA